MIENHPNIYTNHSCSIMNCIVQIEEDKKFNIWLLNISDKGKKLTHHTRVSIVKTAPYVLYSCMSINENVHPEEKESEEDNILDLKKWKSLTVDTSATRKWMPIHGQFKSLTPVMDQHYQTDEKKTEKKKLIGKID